MLAKRVRTALLILVTLSLVAVACGSDDGDGGETGSTTGTTTATTGTETGTTGGTTGAAESACAGATGGDLLQRVCEEGVIRVSTDPAYPPQSELNEDGEFEGFDIDVATEIATRLGVDIQWETPEWTAITSGGWSDRWDMSVGSMTVTAERDEVLFFSPAYYFTPAAVAVHADNTTIQDVTSDLDGARIGVCGECTYDAWLQGNLNIPGYTFDYFVDNPVIETYNTDTTAIRDLTLGDGIRLDAVISALPTLEGAIDSGEPIKIVGDPVFYEPLSVAFDRGSALDATSLVAAVGSIIEEMHADGTMSDLSMTWYGTDLTVAT